MLYGTFLSSFLNGTGGGSSIGRIRSNLLVIRTVGNQKWYAPSTKFSSSVKPSYYLLQKQYSYTNQSYLFSTLKYMNIHRNLRISSLSSLRLLSTSSNTDNSNSSSKNDKNTNDKTTTDNNDKTSDSNEIVLTPGETVVAVSRLIMYAGIAVFAAACAYFIAMELIPTKMSPNRIFDRSFDVVRKDPEVLRRYGDTIKAYGRDHGGHREGRRNFIEHTEYVDADDGSKRVRVRYNIEGRFGQAFVYAEVSAQQPSGEFVYILVQDKSNGHTHTIIDNRAAMTAARLMGNNTEAGSAISQLLTGRDNKK